MPNFIYPRTISIFRSSIASTAQDGLNQSAVSVIAGVAASIQLKRNRASHAMAYPGPTNTDDATPTWQIFFRNSDPALVHKGDEVVDEIGNKYIVEAPYWNSLGYALEAKVYNP